MPAPTPIQPNMYNVDNWTVVQGMTDAEFQTAYNTAVSNGFTTREGETLIRKAGNGQLVLMMVKPLP